ncbi:hypothetical protein [Gordonia sp. NPDC058843]|uniref:hypothetical protein n=1 Tax=Gordonia sp. NPDC058843 TaxID=3346648 RepID=UPI0036AD0AC3
MAITTDRGALTFTFPELGRDARLHVTFQRALRTPGPVGRSGPVGGDAALRLAQGSPDGDAHATIPMWQSEATWLDFSSPHLHPFLVMVGVDGVNAISGRAFTGTPDFGADDYLEVPTQPSLASYRGAAGDGRDDRQFVAPSTHAVEHGGLTGTLLQLTVIPMRADAWARRRRHLPSEPGTCVLCDFSRAEQSRARPRLTAPRVTGPLESADTWHPTTSAAAAVRIVNSITWKSLTGEPVPRAALTSVDYADHGLPWAPVYEETVEHSTPR